MMPSTSRLEKSRILSFFIAFLFFLLLFLFLHFRKSHVEMLPVGSKAPHYIVSQADFFYPDEGATLILKNEASSSVSTIYRVDDEEIREVNSRFQRWITQSENNWREISKDGIENLAIALSLFSNELLQSRFTDLKTMQVIHELGPLDLSMQTHLFFVFLPEENLQGRLPSAFWESLEKCFEEEGITASVAPILLNYFKGQKWKFIPDPRTQSVISRSLTSRIPTQMTFVRAGDRIIDQGEEVTARHLAMFEAMKEAMATKRNLLDPSLFLGSFLFACLFFGAGFFYLKTNQNDIFTSNRKLTLLISAILLGLLVAKSQEIFFIEGHAPLLDRVRFSLLVPFTALLLVCLSGFRVALFSILFLSTLYVVALPVETLPFLGINVFTSLAAIIIARKIRRRKELFIVAAKSFLVAVAVILAFHFYEEHSHYTSLFYDITSAFLFMGGSAILVLGLLPLFESLFQVMTDITMMEWMDPSLPLLRRLMMEAPGTYQHSLLVGNLAEAAASEIGANALLCRVGCAYHDIGKLAHPTYFTENSEGVDMHQLLTAQESAKVIIDHVSEGVKLAEKEGLPKRFIDVIQEHHGTSLVFYFYHKALESAEDKSKVKEEDYRYKGPKPKSKETTLIMIADTVEAAFRSLDICNDETVAELVDRLVVQKSEDGQFDDSPLSFEELCRVKKVLVKNLLALSHPRIKYPSNHSGEEG